jgi:hypothetical protein
MLSPFALGPDEDRWRPFDRYLRRIIRRLLMGKPRPSSHARAFLGLYEGLDRIGVPCRSNDFGLARKNPKSLVSNSSPADGLRFEITLPRDKAVWIGKHDQEFTRASSSIRGRATLVATSADIVSSRPVRWRWPGRRGASRSGGLQ